MEEKKEEQVISPSQYFDFLKSAKQEVTTEMLKDSFGVFAKLAEKYNALGQTESLKKLCFLADVLTKEEKLIDMGVTTFVYKDTIIDYIENVADKTVKIIELSRYMREIPDEIAEVVVKTKDIFDKFYVVFTDYTGKEERKVDKERRDKDPILFGSFTHNNNVADRFYFIGDWVDEFCDLTLDKMVSEYKEKKGYSPVIEEKIPKTSEELLEVLKVYQVNDSAKLKYGISLSEANIVSVPNYMESNKNSSDSKKSFFKKIRSVFNK